MYDVSVAYRSGYRAFIGGEPRKDCPYRDEASIAEWLAGYTDAENAYLRKPKIDRLQTRNDSDISTASTVGCVA